MEDLERLAELSARLGRIEGAVASLAASLTSLAEAYQRGLRDVTFSQVAYLGDHRALTYLSSGQKIFVDTQSVDIGTHLMYGGQWEPDYTTAFVNLLKPGDKVLDIGANHGVYALLAAQKIGLAGHVHAFEPSRKFYDLIRASVSVNGLDRIITVENFGVADRAHETTLLADVHWSGSGHLRSSDDRAEDETALTKESIHCIRLDDYFSQASARVDVIKMDIEGAEGLALKGMAALIDRSTTVKIMMEFCPVMLGRYTCDASFVRDFLERRGFMCWTIRPDGTLQPARWEPLLADPKGLQNIVLSRQGLA